MSRLLLFMVLLVFSYDCQHYSSSASALLAWLQHNTVDCYNDRQMAPILLTFCTDERCDVHQCLLAVRETKHGWFDLFCPGSVACIDNAQLYSAMVGIMSSSTID